MIEQSVLAYLLAVVVKRGGNGLLQSVTSAHRYGRRRLPRHSGTPNADYRWRATSEGKREKHSRAPTTSA